MEITREANTVIVYKVEWKDKYGEEHTDITITTNEWPRPEEAAKAMITEANEETFLGIISMKLIRSENAYIMLK